MFHVLLILVHSSVESNCSTAGTVGFAPLGASLTLSMHVQEGYSSHFVCLSVCLVCLSVAHLEDGGIYTIPAKPGLSLRGR